MDLETRLKEITQEPILSELKGSGGLLVVTPSELIFIGPETVQRAPLEQVRRVASTKGGLLLIAGKEETFIEAPVTGFDLGELKLFFEGVKGYVAKARRGELVPPEPPPGSEAVEEAFAPTPTQETPPVIPEEEPVVPPPSETEPPRTAYEEEPEASPPAPGRNPLRLPLKLLALLTWGYTAALVYLFPTLDPLWLGALVLGGLGLGLTEWQVADL